MLVLIDTWWNVNSRAVPLMFIDFFVLIDTWWNVNFQALFLRASSRTRFNRYMVECEYIERLISEVETDGFNRYMVECEYTMQKLAATTATRFNRYMVECE